MARNKIERYLTKRWGGYHGPTPEEEKNEDRWSRKRYKLTVTNISVASKTVILTFVCHSSNRYESHNYLSQNMGGFVKKWLGDHYRFKAVCRDNAVHVTSAVRALFMGEHVIGNLKFTVTKVSFVNGCINVCFRMKKDRGDRKNIHQKLETQIRAFIQKNYPTMLSEGDYAIMVRMVPR